MNSEYITALKKRALKRSEAMKQLFFSYVASIEQLSKAKDLYINADLASLNAIEIDSIRVVISEFDARSKSLYNAYYVAKNRSDEARSDLDNELSKKPDEKIISKELDVAKRHYQDINNKLFDAISRKDQYGIEQLHTELASARILLSIAEKENEKFIKDSDPDQMIKDAHEQMLVLWCVLDKSSEKLQKEILNVVLMVKSALILKKTGAPYTTESRHALSFTRNVIKNALSEGLIALLTCVNKQKYVPRG